MAQQQQNNRGGQQVAQQGERRLTTKEVRKQQYDGLVSTYDALEPELVAVAAKGVDAQKLKRIFTMALQKNADLLECTRESWISALMHCAQDGLMPDGREAAFVKFNNVVQYMPMVYGLRKKILQSGEITSIFTAVVYQAEFDAGLFTVVLGSDPRIEHRPMLGIGDRGPIIAAYSVATFKPQPGSNVLERSFEVMTAADIAKVRAVSKAKRDDSPWKVWEGEMSRKTVLRRHAKSLPMNSDMRDVEVETLFDAAEFARNITPKADDKGVDGGPARSSQLGTAKTSVALDALEERAGVGGMAAEIDAGDGGKVEDGEIVDRETGEITHTGNQAKAAPIEEKREPQQETAKSAEALEQRFEQQREAAAEAGTDNGPIKTTDAEDEQLARDNAEADRIIAAYTGSANVIDLRSRRDENQAAVDAMGEEAAGRVARAFSARSKALSGGK